jgi:predicted Zn-dependent protease
MTASSPETASSPKQASSPEAQATPSGESLFEQAIARYSAGAPIDSLIADFSAITEQAPRHSAGWTCLAWLQLLAGQPLAAMKSAKVAVRLNPQDPQSRINLSLAMLETGTKGVREHIDLARKVLALAPELATELQDSIADGLARKPNWQAMLKVQAWLQEN